MQVQTEKRLDSKLSKPGLMQSVPPLNDLFKQAGMSLPDFLGEDIQEALKKSQEEAVKRAAEADNAETLDPKRC